MQKAHVDTQLGQGDMSGSIYIENSQPVAIYRGLSNERGRPRGDVLELNLFRCFEFRKLRAKDLVMISDNLLGG